MEQISATRGRRTRVRVRKLAYDAPMAMAPERARAVGVESELFGVVAAISPRNVLFGSKATGFRDSLSTHGPRECVQVKLVDEDR